jgi:hypothetical protein
MPKYEARFLTGGHNVFSKVQFQAAHDEAAVRLAIVALRTSIASGHEIWRRSRLVDRQTYVADAYEAAPEAPRDQNAPPT